MSTIEITGLHKAFGKLEVLRGIDLAVEPGEVVCVIGPSGSGKSTLLRCVNLLEPIQAGRIIIAGNFQSFKMWLIIGIIYFVVIMALTKLSDRLEHRLVK